MGFIKCFFFFFWWVGVFVWVFLMPTLLRSIRLIPCVLYSSQSDVKNFLSSSSLQLELTEHQEGKTRVFMRESQKEKLDTLMHHTILKKILVIQRWYRAKRQRKLFVRIRCAVLRIQVSTHGSQISLTVANNVLCFQ